MRNSNLGQAIIPLLFASLIAVSGGVAAQSTTTAGDSQDSEGTSDDIVTAILMKEVVRIVEGNITAAERESGEMAKLIRALSGVSITDIRKHGICGGSNSEVRKLFGSFCNEIK